LGRGTNGEPTENRTPQGVLIVLFKLEKETKEKKQTVYANEERGRRGLGEIRVLEFGNLTGECSRGGIKLSDEDPRNSLCVGWEFIRKN